MLLPIETNRLTLRDYREEDWFQVHAYARDPEVLRFMDWGPNSEADTRAFIARILASEHPQPRRVFELAVIFKATELTRALIEFSFLHLPVRRVWAKCRPENAGFSRVAKKAGLSFEEYLQNDRTAKGEVVDSIRCGITRQGWLKR